MKTSALMVCKAFLDRIPAEEQEGLKHLLPESQREKMETFPPLPSPKRELLFTNWLDEIHPSWLAPYMRTMSQGDIPLFLSALQPYQARELQKLLGHANHFPKLTPLGKEHLRNILLTQLLPAELIPLAFLPDSPLNPLLFIDQKKLEPIIRLLGLHDLSYEMRHIIATTELKKIFHALTKTEGEFLKTLLLHREPLIFQRLFLQKWNGSQEHLQQLLDERGIARLGLALHHQNASFVWYFTHRLEMQLAMQLLKYQEQPLPNERTEKILLDQIKKIFSFLEINTEAAA